MRKLKYHEHKLLKKVDFLTWKSESSKREASVVRRYRLQDAGDYKKYNKLCGLVTRLVSLLKKMDQRDPVREELTEKLLLKLYRVGAIPTQKSLEQCNRLSVSSFCRRRLAVVLVRLNMAENLKDACKFVDHGHVRVGPEPVTNPAYLVTRDLEDHVTWTDSSSIKRKVQKYNDKLDDFELLQA